MKIDKSNVWTLIVIALIIVFGLTIGRCEAEPIILYVDTAEAVDTVYKTTGSYTEACYKKNPETGQLEPTECNKTYMSLRGFPVAFKGSLQMIRTSDSTWYWIDSGAVYVPYWWNRWPLIGKVGSDSVTVQLGNITVTAAKTPGAVVRIRKKEISARNSFLLNGRKVKESKIRRLSCFNKILIKH